MAAAQATEKHGDDWGLTMRDIYINSNLNPLLKLTSSSSSTELKDILSWNISQMITKIIPISMGIATSYGMKQGILLWIWWESQWKLKHDQNFPHGGKAIVEQILASEERQTLKSPKTKTLVDGSIERTSSMLDEIESKTVHKDEEDDK